MGGFAEYLGEVGGTRKYPRELEFWRPEIKSELGALIWYTYS